MGWIIKEGQKVVNHKPVVSLVYHFGTLGLHHKAV